MKNILEAMFTGKIAPLSNFMPKLELLPNFRFDAGGRATDDFLSLGLSDFRGAVNYDQIGGYKLALHRKFFENWMRDKNLNERFGFDGLWNDREQCIASLAQVV